MSKLVLVEEIYGLLVAVEMKESSPCKVLEQISEILQLNLEEFGVKVNLQNVGQVANMVVAQLFPDEPLSCFVNQKVKEGVLPEFSQEQGVHQNLINGCAVVVMAIRDSFSDLAPREGARLVYKEIEKMGVLPSDYIE